MQFTFEVDPSDYLDPPGYFKIEAEIYQKAHDLRMEPKRIRVIESPGGLRRTYIVEGDPLPPSFAQTLDDD